MNHKAQALAYFHKDRVLTALILYLLVVYSKRFWLGSLGTTMFWVADVVCFVLIPGVLYFWIKQIENPYPAFQTPVLCNIETDYGSLIFQTVILLMVLGILHPISQRIGNQVHSAYPDVLASTLNYDLKVPKMGLLKFSAGLFMGITAGLVEEFFYRGLIYKLLRTHVSSSKWLFVIVSTIIFSTAHWAGGLGHVAAVSVFGFGLAIAFLCTKDIRPLMAAHAIFDFLYFFSVRS
jgi:membrane protease YdiL (CAAX protease family)